MTREEKIALKKYKKGEQWKVSTHIDEDTIIAGYGKLNYDFEYPLPHETIIEIYGTDSWKERIENINKNLTV